MPILIVLGNPSLKRKLYRIPKYVSPTHSDVKREARHAHQGTPVSARTIRRSEITRTATAWPPNSLTSNRSPEYRRDPQTNKFSITRAKPISIERQVREAVQLANMDPDPRQNH